MKKNRKEKLTLFEWKVFAATLTIPIGQTRSYQWIANKVGSPKAVRAVGQALRKNPYPVIIPCHRVIRQDGSLGGYCGKLGHPKKEKLLALERRIVETLQGKSEL
jgi:methylated-DNA-[protein]-cysteine S-methyltransferase